MLDERCEMELKHQFLSSLDNISFFYNDQVTKSEDILIALFIEQVFSELCNIIYFCQ